ncbi:UNVERIFIED_CONTAM: hypothetical protein HDU68_000224 [Siphonaria sp. JEL0065]|nr:hypothetical protein HDU68_000224 [Siphonaria sp. JEL0065]
MKLLAVYVLAGHLLLALASDVWDRKIGNTLVRPNELPIGLARAAADVLQLPTSTPSVSKSPTTPTQQGTTIQTLSFNATTMQLMFGNQLVMDNRFMDQLVAALKGVSLIQCGIALQDIGRLPVRVGYTAEVGEIAAATGVSPQNLIIIAKEAMESFRPYKALFDTFTKVAATVPPVESAMSEGLGIPSGTLPKIPSRPPFSILPQLIDEYAVMVVYLGLPSTVGVAFFEDLSGRSEFNSFFRIRAPSNKTDSQLQTLNIINRISLANRTLGSTTLAEVESFVNTLASDVDVSTVLVSGLARGVLESMESNNVTTGPVHAAFLAVSRASNGLVTASTVGSVVQGSLYQSHAFKITWTIVVHITFAFLFALA